MNTFLNNGSFCYVEELVDRKGGKAQEKKEKKSPEQDPPRIE